VIVAAPAASTTTLNVAPEPDPPVALIAYVPAVLTLSVNVRPVSPSIA